MFFFFFLYAINTLALNEQFKHQLMFAIVILSFTVWVIERDALHNTTHNIQTIDLLFIF